MQPWARVSKSSRPSSLPTPRMSPPQSTATPLSLALVTPVRLAGREGLTATGADGVLRRGEHASQGDIAAFEQESGREAELVFYPFEGKRRHPPGVCPVKRYSCAALVADCQFLFTVFSQPNRNARERFAPDCFLQRASRFNRSFMPVSNRTGLALLRPATDKAFGGASHSP